MRGLEEMDLSALRAKLNNLATASEKPVIVVDKTESGEVIPHEAKEFKAIWNNKTNELASIVSKGYVVIQHSDAFSAVIDALVATKPDAKVRASIMEYKGKAWMTAVFSDIKADDGAQGIELGFKVVNSFDKTSSLKYGGNQGEFKQHFEFFGYRLACMNGMTVRVPNIDLNTIEVKARAIAKVGDFVDARREAVRAYGKTEATNGKIRHYGKTAVIKVDAVRDALMKLPQVAKKLEEQIKLVQGIALTKKEAEDRLYELGYCERTVKKLLTQFEFEEKTQWGLYNTVTAYATHTEKLSPIAIERELDKAKPLLMEARVVA